MPPAALSKFLRGAPYFPVADVSTTGTYYRDVFGFQLEYAAGTPPEFAIYSRDRCPLMLRRVSEPSRIQPNEAQGGTWDAFSWVTDLQSLYEEFRAKRAVFVYGPCSTVSYSSTQRHAQLLGIDHAVVTARGTWC